MAGEMLCSVTGNDIRRHVFALFLVLVHAGSNDPHGALAECLTLYVFTGFLEDSPAPCSTAFWRIHCFLVKPPRAGIWAN